MSLAAKKEWLAQLIESTPMMRILRIRWKIWSFMEKNGFSQAERAEVLQKILYN